jgi:predicted nuclease of predicted toxin-antitoxin system
MTRFLVDEDLPRSLARALRGAGMEAEDVRDIGLSGEPDEAVFRHARENGLTLVTADMGFASILLFPPGSHPGLVVSRLPETLSIAVRNRIVVEALSRLAEEEITGNIIIIEPDRIRLRRGR